MTTVEGSDFNEFLDRECAERAKERFRKRYLEKKKIPVPGRRKGFWQRMREAGDGRRKDNP